MKRFSIICLILVWQIAAQNIAFCEGSPAAGNRTGVYGSAVIKPAFFNNNPALVAGANLMVTIAGSYEVGIGFYNLLTNSIEAAYMDSLAKTHPYLHSDYFGLEFAYIINPESDWQFRFASLFGGGRVTFTLTRRNEDGSLYNPQFGDDWHFVIEPSAGISCRMTSWAKANASIGFRLMPGIEYSFYGQTFDIWNLSGLSLNISISMGKF